MDEEDVVNTRLLAKKWGRELLKAWEDEDE